MSIRIGMRSAALLAAALLAMAACLRGASAFSLSQDVGFVRDQVRGARQPAGLDVSEAEDLPPEQWFTEQIVDHFGDSDETWSQRYFVNDTFFEPYAPSDYGQVVFLCVGGEGPAFQPTVVVTGGPHCAWMIHLAEKFGALVVAVEHRFYGKSMPRPDFSTESLEVHGSRQAQEDLRLFRNHITNVTGGLHESAKWVTFGGSYPGMMAAWARELYPDLFHASVSSSAPVEAVVNMQVRGGGRCETHAATLSLHPSLPYQQSLTHTSLSLSLRIGLQRRGRSQHDGRERRRLALLPEEHQVGLL